MVSSEAELVRRWLRFLAERAPIPAMLFIGASQAVSASVLAAGRVDVVAVLLAAGGIAALLTLLRIMDELKDLAKDRVAHPERPLARGLISPEEARRGVAQLGAALLAYALLVAALRGAAAGACLAATVGWAFLMYREFFAPDQLARNAFVYAITHQVILIPLYGFAAATAAPAALRAAPIYWFALTGLGASFAYEVGRKLDPHAHPLLGTYLHRHGRMASALAIVIAAGVLAVGAWQLALHALLWPLALLVLLTLALAMVRPARYRLVEGATSLLAAVQMLAPALRHAWKALA